MDDETRTCPFCAENIKAAAIVCKHCGRELDSDEGSASSQGSAAESRSPNGCLGVVGVIVVFGLLFGFCSGNEGSSGQSSEDAAGQAACTHFGNVLGDVDILADDEIVEKLREVNRTAGASDSAELAAAARAMLAAGVADDGPALLDAAADFTDACTRVS